MIVIKAADWFELARSHVVWGIAMQAIQSYALLLAERREAALLTLGAKDRYLQFIADYPGLEARVRQYDIASYLGITPVALSRIRGTPAPKNREEINLG
jgi:CRP-like cAMP-binding protein